MSTDRDRMQELVDEVVKHANALERLLEPGDGEWNLRKLLDVYDWAVEQLPFKVGSRVSIFAGPFAPPNGYAAYNAVWMRRPSGIVEDIYFVRGQRGWRYLIKLDDVPDLLFQFGPKSLRVEGWREP